MPRARRRLRRRPALRGRSRPGARAQRPGARGARERRHDAQPARGLRASTAPASSTRRRSARAVEPPPDAYALSKRLGEEACRLHPAPRDGRPPDRRSSAPARSPGRARPARSPRSPPRALDGEPIVIPRRPRAHARLRLRRRRRRRRSRRSSRDGRWSETLTLGQRARRPRCADAAELVRRGGRHRRRRSRPREGRSPPGENESYAADRGRRGYPSTPARSRRLSRSMSTGSAAIPLLKAAPEPDQLADRLEGGPWRGIELVPAPGARRRRRRAGARDRDRRAARSAARRLAVTAEAPRRVAERRLRPRRPARRRGARRHRAQRRVRRRDRLARADDPPLRPA